MMRMHFWLLSVPSFRPSSLFFQLPLILHKALFSLSTLPSSLMLPPTFFFFKSSAFPPNLSPMSPSYPNTTLSFTPLFSSSSSSPSLHFTPFRLCPQHDVFPPAPPLTTHSNSTLAASASSPSLHFSCCRKLHCQILTVKYSFIQLHSSYSSPLSSCLWHNWNDVGHSFRSKN